MKYKGWTNKETWEVFVTLTNNLTSHNACLMSNDENGIKGIYSIYKDDFSLDISNIDVVNWIEIYNTIHAWR